MVDLPDVQAKRDLRQAAGNEELIDIRFGGGSLVVATRSPQQGVVVARQLTSFPRIPQPDS